ncbi:Calcium-independent phospholipase A2-gamma [Branchiostoma belcheri]|nr:Calcium-independent phospholipase A2-gamma [Branchiostoma belcheri]
MLPFRTQMTGTRRVFENQILCSQPAKFIGRYLRDIDLDDLVCEPNIVRFKGNKHDNRSTQGQSLVCEASGFPTPDITVTFPSGLNKTVQSGGRVTVGTNSTVTIDVTADAAGLYVCTATKPYHNSMDKEQAGVLVLILVILTASGPTEASCTCSRPSDCNCDWLNLTSGQSLVCEASGFPTPNITVTFPSGLNKTVQSGGRVTVGTNSTATIDVTADAAGLYVCTATSPVGSAFASLCVNIHLDKPTPFTLEQDLHNPTTFTIEPDPGKPRTFTIEPDPGKPTTFTIEPDPGKSTTFTLEPDLDRPTTFLFEPALKSSPGLTVPRNLGKPENSSELYNNMDKEQAGVLIFLLVILEVFGPTEGRCFTKHRCHFNRMNLTSIPQDLPRHGDILVCEASGIPTPDITVTLSSGLNKTVQSGGRVTEGANGTIIINVTADAAGLYVCTATNPVGSTFASLFVYARQENPTTLEPALTSSPRFTIIRISGKPESSNDEESALSFSLTIHVVGIGVIVGTGLIGVILVIKWHIERTKNLPSHPDPKNNIFVTAINPQYESTVSELAYEDTDKLSPTGHTEPKTAIVTDQTALSESQAVVKTMINPQYNTVTTSLQHTCEDMNNLPTGPTDSNSNDCTATDNTANVTASQGQTTLNESRFVMKSLINPQYDSGTAVSEHTYEDVDNLSPTGPTDSNSNGCTATDNTDNVTASQDQTVLGLGNHGKDMENKINSFSTSCNRIMLNIKRRDRVTNNSIYDMTQTSPLIQHYVQQVLGQEYNQLTEKQIANLARDKGQRRDAPATDR